MPSTVTLTGFMMLKWVEKESMFQSQRQAPTHSSARRFHENLKPANPLITRPKMKIQSQSTQPHADETGFSVYKTFVGLHSETALYYVRLS